MTKYFHVGKEISAIKKADKALTEMARASRRTYRVPEKLPELYSEKNKLERSLGLHGVATGIQLLLFLSATVAIVFGIHLWLTLVFSGLFMIFNARQAQRANVKLDLIQNKIIELRSTPIPGDPKKIAEWEHFKVLDIPDLSIKDKAGHSLRDYPSVFESFGSHDAIVGPDDCVICRAERENQKEQRAAERKAKATEQRARHVHERSEALRKLSVEEHKLHLMAERIAGKELPVPKPAPPVSAGEGACGAKYCGCESYHYSQHVSSRDWCACAHTKDAHTVHHRGLQQLQEQEYEYLKAEAEASKRRLEESLTRFEVQTKVNNILMGEIGRGLGEMGITAEPSELRRCVRCRSDRSPRWHTAEAIYSRMPGDLCENCRDLWVAHTIPKLSITGLYEAASLAHQHGDHPLVSYLMKIVAQREEESGVKQLGDALTARHEAIVEALTRGRQNLHEPEQVCAHCKRTGLSLRLHGGKYYHHRCWARKQLGY